MFLHKENMFVYKQGSTKPKTKANITISLNVNKFLVIKYNYFLSCTKLGAILGRVFYELKGIQMKRQNRIIIILLILLFLHN